MRHRHLVVPVLAAALLTGCGGSAELEDPAPEFSRSILPETPLQTELEGPAPSPS